MVFISHFNLLLSEIRAKFQTPKHGSQVYVSVCVPPLAKNAQEPYGSSPQAKCKQLTQPPI